MFIEFGEACPFAWFWDRLIEAKCNVCVNGRDLATDGRTRTDDGRKAIVFYPFDDEYGEAIRSASPLVIAIDDIETVTIY